MCTYVSTASGDQTAHIWRYMVQLPAPQPPPDVSVSIVVLFPSLSFYWNILEVVEFFLEVCFLSKD